MRIDQPIMKDDSDGGKITKGLSGTNAGEEFRRKTGRHTNHEEQQIHFSGDKGFEFASEITKDIIWGKK